MTSRFLNGPVLWAIVGFAAGIAAILLTVEPRTTLKGRGESLTAAGQRPVQGQTGKSGETRPGGVVTRSPRPLNVNVSLLKKREPPALPGRARVSPSPRAPGSRSLNRHSLAYYRYWARSNGHRLALEHAHVHRLLNLLHRARTTQAHETPATDWRGKQIAAADTIGREGDAAGTDPWPNCPDPYDHGGASWDDTARCENGGNWDDSPGYFRCGLQFDPGWERRFGRLCP